MPYLRPWATKGRVAVCPIPLVTSPWPAMPCCSPGAGRASMPGRRHRVTLADHLPQLHSSTAESQVLGAAGPFCFLGTASHSTQGCPHAQEQPLPLLPWGKPRPLENTSAGQTQSLKPVFSWDLSPGLHCAQLGFQCSWLETCPWGSFFHPLLKCRCLWSIVGHDSSELCPGPQDDGEGM